MRKEWQIVSAAAIVLVVICIVIVIYAPEWGLISNENSTVLPPTASVDINTATEEQLMQLPGIGEVTARAILDWRAEYGSFCTLEELMEVDGIGEELFESLRPYLTLTP